MPEERTRRDFLQLSTMAGAVALAPSQSTAKEAAVSDDLTAEQVRDLLKLEPNQTCGFVRVTYVSEHKLKAGSLPEPFAAERPVGSGLYFMVTPQAPVRLHRIRNDQLYHYYKGDPLEVVLMKVDGTSQKVV